MSCGKGFLCVIKYILLKKSYNVCMKTSRKIYAMNLFSNLIFYAPVALLVRTNRGISLSQFFVLQAILSVTCMVFEFPLGVLTDKIGLKKSIVLAQFTMLTARIILLIANNFMLFAVEALLEGIAFALNSGTISAYIYKLFGNDNYSNNISKFYNWGTIAFIVSTVMFPFINATWNINALILVTIIANTIATVISIFIPNTDNSSDNEEQFDLSQTLKLLVHDKTFRVIVLIVSLFNLSFLLINFFYVKVIIDSGYSENIVSPLILAYSTLQLSQTFIINHLGEKRAWNKVSLFSVISALFFMGICAISEKPVILLMIMLPTILSILGIFIEKIQNNYIDTKGFKNHRATMLSAFSFFADVFEVVFLLANSYISSFNYKYIFIFISLSLFLSALLLRNDTSVSSLS